MAYSVRILWDMYICGHQFHGNNNLFDFLPILSLFAVGCCVFDSTKPTCFVRKSDGPTRYETCAWFSSIWSGNLYITGGQCFTCTFLKNLCHIDLDFVSLGRGCCLWLQKWSHWTEIIQIQSRNRSTCFFLVFFANISLAYDIKEM